jgi:excinuclease ABC subunit C
MQQQIENLNFEGAQLTLEKLDILQDYQARSTVVSAVINDADIFTIRTDETLAFVSYLKVINGALINTETLEFEKNLDHDEQHLLSYAIPIIRERHNSIAPEIIVPIDVICDEALQITIPKIGEKKKLLELAIKNLDYFLAQKRKMEAERNTKQSPAERVLTTLMNDLQMNELPLHIETFDNSNIQGSNPVSSCVVFKNAKPSKKDYRHFKVRSVQGPNDFATMEEIVYRRYKRMIEEESPLPQLVIIDGGKGQLSAAMKSIDLLGLKGRFTLIGIAKKLEEIFYPNDSIPLYINKKSESLKLIQHCRNEAHRFAITFHRDVRSKNFLKTELTEIDGIGEKNAEKLLKVFGSIRNLRSKSVEDIAAEVGNANAHRIMSYFNSISEDLNEEE